MHITIDVSNQQPPCGRISIDGSEGKPFEGWLQLLSVLTGALEATIGAGQAPGPVPPAG